MEQINAAQFMQMMQAGAHNLEKKAQTVNALNVFPVPDGDTGTNMSLTIQAGVQEMLRSKADSVGDLAVALSKGLLMGARGNSGVILSQLFRGFSKAISTETSVSTKQFALALQKGIETAYQAVMKPVEGTVLTVARMAAEAASMQMWKKQSLEEMMETVYQAANVALAKTPDLLPVLKETGVVDAGGQGLVYIYQGMLSALKGNYQLEQEEFFGEPDEFIHESHQEKIDPQTIEYGYCTEFLIDLHTTRRPTTLFDEPKFRQELQSFGDSLLVVADEQWVKVHIHAEHPGDVLNYAMKYGDLTRMKIDNMRKQHEKITHPPTPSKGRGFLTVTTGQGIAKVFQSIGVDLVVEGGQSMNPSADELTKAVKQIGKEEVVILPNNKNIIMTAEQVKHLTDINIIVLKTKTIPQGLAAMLAYRSDEDWEVNQKQMKEAIQRVRSGEVTYAIRDTSIGELSIHKGDYLGIADGTIRHVGQDIYRTAEALLGEMVDEDAEMITIFYGEDLQSTEVVQWGKRLEEQFPDQEIELHAGNQPLYYFVIAVE
ncbi:hypothetical protein SAMN05444392_10239 [Seinonella peptonophila]|uniref:DhaL domain-containing protein n=1 Tax=Seinonella peptonophila TaxID=112248 RepID=A0A1M4UUS8_9BACL|nr:DAK2 domain-containing protein [Seinonella peptonophila]SHE60511.1 hypothetical protein SAMN05444392_10239 [Seinonella peptonophila]